MAQPQLLLSISDMLGQYEEDSKATRYGLDFSKNNLSEEDISYLLYKAEQPRIYGEDNILTVVVATDKQRAGTIIDVNIYDVDKHKDIDKAYIGKKIDLKYAPAGYMLTLGVRLSKPKLEHGLQGPASEPGVNTKQLSKGLNTLLGDRYVT